MSGERDPELLHSALRSAHEKLCVAQVHVETDRHRMWLQDVLDTIERIGVFSCRDWSTYREPTTEDPS